VENRDSETISELILNFGVKVKLKEIDLSKANEHEHPDIVLEKEYLVNWNGHYIIGKFFRVSYGLCFVWFWGMNTLQFDAPGFNSSNWRKVWEITFSKKEILWNQKQNMDSEIKKQEIF